MAFMPAKKTMITSALEGNIAKLHANQEISFLDQEKQVTATLEAQIAQLRKEKEDMKTELGQLRSEKEAAEKQLNELKSEKSTAENELNQLKDKLGKAEGKVNELQMYNAATECSKPFGAQLLPKIPNEVTLDYICTKLPWSAFRSLSSVNHCWREAIKSRQVYDARVHAQSLESLVCITRAPYYEGSGDISSTDEIKGLRFEKMKGMGFEAMIALYSLTDDSCYQLPQIPNLNTRSRYIAGGLPACCQCVSLDGKIYVLGGTDDPDCDWRERCGSAEVYVLDVAEQRPWKQLASMQEARMDFASCVMDGKIYVFGGRSLDEPVHGSEVYDPERDEWSPITPMTSMRFMHKVARNGEELVVFDGEYYERVNEEGDEVAEYDSRTARNFEIYHPAENEWRVRRNVDVAYCSRPMFTANGIAYLMDWGAIYSFDGDRGFSWMNRQENSFPNMRLPTCYSVEPCAAVAVNDEVLAIVKPSPESDDGSDEGTFLFQSIGFDKEDNETGLNGGVKTLRWQKLNFDFPLEGMYESGSMFRIQL